MSTDSNTPTTARKSRRSSMSIKSLSEVSDDSMPAETRSNSSSSEGSMDFNGFKEQPYSPEVWIFIVIAIIVLIICFWIAQPELEWYKDQKKYTLFENFWVLAIILVIVAILMAYCSYVSYMKGNSQQRSAIMITFIAGMLLLFLWFVVFYKMKNLSVAFYFAIALLFVAFIQIYFVWNVYDKAGWGLIPYIIFIGFLVGLNYNISDQNTV